MIHFQEAQRLLAQYLPPQKTTTVKLQDAVGCFLAQDVVADRDYPPFARATMDGYALRQSELTTYKQLHVCQNILAGDGTAARAAEMLAEQKGITARIMTGAAVPSWADAVIPIEEVQGKSEQTEDAGQKKYIAFCPEFLAKHKPKDFLNIARQGEDVCQGEVIFTKGHLIRQQSILTLASLGCAQVQVLSAPKVAIISGGDEIVDIEKNPSEFEIRNSNASVLQSFLSHFGITPRHCLHYRDDEQEIRVALQKVLDCDIVLLSGGISQGDADFIGKVLQSLQVQKIFCKVAIKPGKPFWAGYHKNETGNTLFMALPGNPMAVQTACKIFLEPYLRTWAGAPPMLSYCLPLAEGKKKKSKRREFFPCTVENRQEDISRLHPVRYNGSGDIRAAAFSHGLAIIDEDTEELLPETIVEFIPWEVS